MKFVILLGVFFSLSVFGQVLNDNAQDLLNATSNSNTSTDKKLKYKFCTTTSCCEVGGFGIAVFSETTCTYVYTYPLRNGNSNVVVMDLKTEKGEKYALNEITFPNDLILPADYKADADGNAEVLVLKAGKYQVINGQLAFSPSTQRIRLTCFVTEHTGTIFGNPYHYTSQYCLIHVWFNKGLSGNGLLTIDISGDKTLIELASKNKGVLKFDQDLVVSNKLLDAKISSIIVKAGTYKVNENNKIYIKNYEIR
ncbi:hypothetical protein [Epilithonimonas vandammei]|uniref:Uncharacterized protein n=1 Tax=Epilithonimonas vandammei TaxID=2487072 RepID=A0A3G8Y549_9FLAO|nr:hypothetical protein [Epilithonimonas vandammei]AZI39217.1 hypothetical protein EIB74_04250 [Epilithonimonas vandammei]